MKRSSNSRIWNEARTSTAMSDERNALALRGLDLLADVARLFRAVPDADHARLLARRGIGVERLAEPRAVVGDEAGGGARMWPVER